MIYQKYNSTYENEVLELLNICFEDKNIISKSFRWKHFDSYFNNKEIAMVAIDGKKVCAFVCFTPVEVLNGENRYGFYSCSVQATHPNYRRRGVVSALTQMVERELPQGVNYLGFSNKSGVQIDLHSKKINYQILGQMNTIYTVSFPYVSNFKIRPVELISKVDPKSNYLGFRKNIDYVNWRYLDNPKNVYKYYEIVYRGTNIGYIIAKKNKFVFDIFDIVVTDSNDFGECIKAFNRYAFKKLIPICSYTFLPNIFWKSVLPGLAITKKNELFFTIKSNDKYLLNVDNWIIQGGDVQ